MGKTQSKNTEEHIIIAQNGAGNSAASSAVATEESNQASLIRYEIYLLFIITCILAGIAYMMWRKCKENYAHYMKRELQDVGLATIAVHRGEQSLNSSSPPRQVIV
ncbi:hypothetical protein KGM_209965 [Danaus plexippus plexippus]|uniref:Uncharacterized protein n=1 Tax=Danaus plexippus plexippus TaxID=278856 RepID=A0A212ETR9_DANPL|nr:hypothetical protein KGM_209965 [Danaus plexippus plexippus]